MAIDTAIWKVTLVPERLKHAELPSERALEDLVVAEPSILSDDLMIIGRQVQTSHGGFIDLLGIQPDASLVVIELKRNRTPRDVVAQAIDYATWVQDLEASRIGDIYRSYAAGGDLADGFRERFGTPLPEEELNTAHHIVIAASSLDESTERIVRYLSDRGLPINVLFFQVFRSGSDLLLSRTWLLDPVQSQQVAASKSDTQSEPWNGEFYCSFGDSTSRSWEEARRYGFISGGGGPWYSRTLRLLSPGDRVWVNIPSVGYVGVGRVIGSVQHAIDFTISEGGVEKPVLSVLELGTYHREVVDDPEKAEYFVRVQWLDAVPAGSAFKEVGLFGNQNTVAKPTTPKWRHTVDRLKEQFPGFDQDDKRLLAVETEEQNASEPLAPTSTWETPA